MRNDVDRRGFALMADRPLATLLRDPGTEGLLAALVNQPQAAVLLLRGPEPRVATLAGG